MEIDEIEKICVIGAGNMGSGIAQLCSQAGFITSMADTQEDFVRRGLDRIQKTLEGGIKRGKITEARAKKVVDNIQITTDLKEAVKGANVVIEAVFEDMDIKKRLFTELDALCDETAIFATNTSTLSITEMANVTKRTDRFAGLHFFYPAAINKLLEIIPGKDTSWDTTNLLTELARALGKIPIIAKDAPGFAVNRFFVPYLNESCKIAAENIANIPTIDRAAKETFGIGLGAFELMNATGIPIAYHSERSLWRALGDFYKPAPILKRQFESNQKWDTSGEIDMAKHELIKKRYLGLIFNIACQLVDEGVAAKEDVDIGATIGLRWRVGPFAMMNELGIQKAWALASEFAKNAAIAIPKSLEHQSKSNEDWALSAVKLAVDKDTALLTICRPSALNALNTKVLQDIDNAFENIQKDADINTVVITGEGKAFVAGADIKEMIEKTPLDAREFTQYGHGVFKKIENSNKVVIAAVNGFALGGGCELALACDIVIASENAKFGLPEVGFGIHPGFGGTQRLPRLIGRNKAKELIFTGDIIDAKEAARIGLVNRVVPPGKLMSAAKKLAAKINSKAPIAIKLAKSAINKGSETDIETGLAYEIETVSLAFSTDDKTEGLTAFVEKRKPKFKGK